MRSPRTPRLAKARQNRTPSLEQLHLDSEPLAKIVSDVLKGWLDGQLPESCKEGTNGVYFFKDIEGKKTAVFKPIDEEGQRPMSPRMSRSPRTPRMNRLRISEVDTTKHQEAIPPKPNKPKPSIDCIREFPLEQLKLIKSTKTEVNGHGIPAGEATMREVAASLIDHDGFYGVPKTAIVKIHHWETLGMKRALLKFPKLLEFEGITKIGSLQEFIDNDGSSEDVSPSFFPVEEVHKIGILDLHLMNVDRNEGNILIKKRKDDTTKCKYELIPIDHGFCIPKYTQIDGTYWAWLCWPQSKVPFSPRMVKHIEEIDVDHDALTLKSQLGIDNDCLRSMKISTLLLKKGTVLGFSLFDLGTFASRSLDDFDTPSALERIIAKTDEQNPSSDEEFFAIFGPLLDASLKVFKKSSDSDS